MRSRFAFPALSLVLCAGVAPPLHAQLDGPIAVQNITNEQLERTGTQNVVEVLKSIGGVRSPIASVPPGQTVSIRGIEQGFRAGDPINVTWHRRQLVLIDGRRPDPACLADLNALPADQCRTIEVISAGAAATYGVDAVAGVVNIITRRPPDPQPDPEPLSSPDDSRFYLGVDVSRRWFINLDKVACDQQAIPGLTSCDNEVKAPSYNLTGEYRLTRGLTLGASYGRSEYTVHQQYGQSTGTHRITASSIDVYGTWRPQVRMPFRPFVFVGGTYWDNEDDREYDDEPWPSNGQAGLRALLGAGGEFRLADHLAVRALLRGVYGGGRDADTNFGIGLGAGYHF
jgi:outer membrane receptor protein involved in Fe transport